MTCERVNKISLSNSGKFNFDIFIDQLFCGTNHIKEIVNPEDFQSMNVLCTGNKIYVWRL